MSQARKPLGHKAYGTIPHLSGSRLGPSDKKAESGQELIATKQARDWRDLVVVQEKLDGSNCAIAKLNGQVLALTRAGYQAHTSPYELHHRFADYVQQNHGRFNEALTEGERWAGEWLALAHGTRYRLPHEPFEAFDIMRNGHQRAPYLEVFERCIRFELPYPRLIHLGQPVSIKNVLKRLEPSGHGALDPVEGAVWRVERDGKVDFLVKYVRPDKVDGKYLPEMSGQAAVWNTQTL
ncbi:MAG: RNA ligase family protein [Tunicatimonas sp.]